MCNARALLLTAAIGGAAYTGGASLGLLGGGAAAGGAAAAAGTTGAVYGGATAAGLTGWQALGLASSALSVGSAYQQAKTQQAVAAENANLANNKATLDEQQGELQAQRVNREASQLQGTQRATMAARGLDLNAGTPSDLIAQTSFFGQQDAATARYNGQMAAWADKQQGASFTAEAQGYGQAAGFGLASGAAMLGASYDDATNTSLLSGGTVSSKWYRGRGPIYGNNQPNLG